MTQPQTALITAFNREQVELVKRTMAKGATDDELKLFLYQAQKKGLDPLSRQIYFQKRNSKNGEAQITIITGIDGYRTIASRTGQYAGNDDPVFDDEKSPSKATVTVYRIVGGIRCPFTATARWEQYYPGDTLGFMWRKMPHLMLGKCAEALALRKAFPEELSGLYVKEEMEQAGKPTMESLPITTVKVEDDLDPRGDPYDPKNDTHRRWLWDALKKQGFDATDAGTIALKMVGRFEEDLDDVIRDFLTTASKI